MYSQIFSQGTIILLNGPSASGKSSIQAEVQKEFDSLYLKIGIDTFFDALIPTPNIADIESTGFLAQYTNDQQLIRSVKRGQDPMGRQTIPLTIGPAGDRILFGMHHAIAAYAKSGNNIVVDYILYKPELLLDLIEALKEQKIYLIGIKAPLEVLEERERNRGTSPIGHARSHFNTVHEQMVYDLELDVSQLTPSQSALKIKEFIENNPNPLGMKKLAARQSMNIEQLLSIQNEIFEKIKENQQQFIAIRQSTGSLIERWQKLLQTLLPIQLEVVKDHSFEATQVGLSRFNEEYGRYSSLSSALLERNKQKWMFLFKNVFGIVEFKEISLEDAQRLISDIVKEITSESFLQQVDRVVTSLKKDASFIEKRQAVVQVLIPFQMAVMERYGFQGEIGYVQAQRAVMDYYYDPFISQSAAEAQNVVFQRAGLL